MKRNKLARSSAVLLMILGLTACATSPSAKPLQIDYSPQFLNCVADFGEKYQDAVSKGVAQPLMRVPPCVNKAIAVWSYSVK